ncbi:biotin attachment protein [Echinicola pacifica]|uniref:Biotin attachment protein n=1 Tax=Echinicola pacifica TaxID=346377 RepID=A0A918UIC3_9BACT|nr:HlyD family efflux transporter periplasmic adaptor subunit [Echinicola pacifica]GGZ12583.1 biotin attachment protein [Echinicola pacifica]
MLNISNNSISKHIKRKDFKAFAALDNINYFKFSRKTVTLLFILLGTGLFLPWTQNIRSEGYVTTRSPEHRPQSIQSVISGRLEQWYVQEGDLVSKGDTLVFISDAKSEYFDPLLVQRTQEQVDAKRQSIQSYEDKVSAIRSQSQAISQGLQLKLRQLQNKIIQANNKVQMDSIDLVAAKTQWEIAENQRERTQQLYDKGLKSLTDLQEKKLKVQETQAKYTVQENKLTNQKNELLNLDIELSSTEQAYQDKLSKARSELQSALSSKLSTQAEVSKLENQVSNYTQRQSLYYITAPQSGFVSKTIKQGLGEMIKEGTDILTIVPDEHELAVEIYIKPQDLPLVQYGNRVRIRFDGWPAIVISGWPEASTGVFTGQVVTIDRSISANGYYRLLVSPDPNDRSWPDKLSIGTGSQSFLLLNTVPIWYEVWRQLNGFPADYYTEEKESPKPLKLKAPLKSVK